MTDATSKEKSNKGEARWEEGGAGGRNRPRQTKKWCYSQRPQEKYVQMPLKSGRERTRKSRREVKKKQLFNRKWDQ